jgi:hypothetical protein
LNLRARDSAPTRKDTLTDPVTDILIYVMSGNIRLRCRTAVAHWPSLYADIQVLAALRGALGFVRSSRAANASGPAGGNEAAQLAVDVKSLLRARGRSRIN